MIFFQITDFFRNHLVSNINEYLENQSSYEKSDSTVLKLMKFACTYISYLFSAVTVRLPPRSSVLSEIHQLRKKFFFFQIKDFFRNHLVSNINEYLENQSSYEKSDSTVLKLMKFAFRCISCHFSPVAVRLPPRSSVLSEIHQLRKTVIFFSNDRFFLEIT